MSFAFLRGTVKWKLLVYNVLVEGRGLMLKRIESKSNKVMVLYDTQTHLIEVHTENKVWKQEADFKASINIKLEGNNLVLCLNDALSISIEEFKNGIGSGIRTTYTNWNYNGTQIEAAFETIVWIDDTYGNLHLELLPLNEKEIRFISSAWPAPFEFKLNDRTAYTVIPMMQGTLIPNNWPEKVEAVEPPMFYERAAYLPWWGQIEDGNGYLAIVETAWDSGYELLHPAGGPTSLNVKWHASLGKLNYKRKLLLSFHENCDYNSLCKVYRKYAMQQGLIVTLNEKEVRNKNLRKLIGSPVIHSSIYTHIKPESEYYDKNNIEANEVLITFEKRIEQLLKLKQMGVEKAYLHLDGWGKMGYDNMHPDVIPPCEQAGGKQGMRALADTCEKLDYLFAIHDQYRDYYTDAESFSESNAMKDVDGKVHYECIWYGGEQTALCTQLSPYYLKRNFEALKSYGINLKGTYLDVFAVIALDECNDKEHMMTRKECMERRIECFRYLSSEGILVSSEEPVEWSVPHMDLVHHAPFPLVNLGGGKARAIPVPLFNLVYHDCLVVPWTVTKGRWGIPEGESGYLHALLNAGVPYLNIDADENEIKRVQVVCNLHEQLANKEMMKHEFVEDSYKKQRTYFSDGTIVEVDFETDEFVITNAK